ncbi:MAG: nucleotidyl transferase AbiEii/AbiGii toxin family protein [bacterium]
MAPTASKDPIKKLEEIKKYRVINQFYLAGGTGLNILLNHRDSMDLDFFTTYPIKPEGIIHAFKRRSKVQVVQMKADTLEFLLDGVPVSFFEYQYPLLESVKYHGIKIASLLDIALMKLIAILQRGEQKDFIDLYSIITKGKVPLQTVFKAIPIKYKSVEIQMGAVLKSLVYFEDADKSPPLRLKNLNWKKIKAFFIENIKRF